MELFDLGSNRYGLEKTFEYKHNWTAFQTAMADLFHGHLNPPFRLPKTAVAVRGFKVMYNQIGPAVRAELVRWAAANDVAVIHLVRKNSVEAYLSGQEAQIRKAFHVAYGNVVPSVAPIEVNVRKVIGHVKTAQSHADYFRRDIAARADLKAIELAYEDLLVPEEQHRRLLALYDFLGANTPACPPPGNVTMMQVRLNTRRCRDRVKNWPELEAALADEYPALLELCERTV